MKSKKYVLVENRDLGLLHPAIEEFYSKPENIEKQFPPDRTPSSKVRYVLMHGLMRQGEKFIAVPDYYFIAPLGKGDFSEIKGTDWDTIRDWLNRGNAEFPEKTLKNQWENLERFDSLLADKIDLIPPKYPKYTKTPIRKPKTHKIKP